MSLVDYASSSEDEEAGEDDEPDPHHDKQDGREERRVEKERPRESATAATVPPQFHQSIQKSSSPSSTYRRPDVVAPSNALSMEKLPDASILLSSPSFSPQQYGSYDRSCHIVSSITEMASKKRERNGSAFVHPSNKNPRGNLPNSRSISDTSSSTFIPPQLKGRSNVVTEDIRKLFVNRHTEPSG